MKNILIFFGLLFSLTAYSQEIISDSTFRPSRAGRKVFSDVGDGVLNSRERTGNTQVYATRSFTSLAELRGFSNPRKGVQYQVTEKGKQGLFEVDVNDFVSPDDGLLCVVSKSGKRFKRVIDPTVKMTLSDTTQFAIVTMSSLNEVVYDNMVWTKRNGTKASDGGTIISTGLFYWERANVGHINPAWFNVKSDSVTDDTQNFIKAYLAASRKRIPLEMPEGKTTRLNTNFTLADVTINGNNSTIYNSRAGSLLVIESNVTLSGISFNGGYSDGSLNKPSLIIRNANNVSLKKCIFFNSDKNIVTVIAGKNITISDCRFFESGNNIQFFDGGENIIIEKCSIINGKGNASSGANGISFNRNAENLVYNNVIIQDNFIKNVPRMGIECFNLTRSTIRNNRIEDAGYMAMSFPYIKESVIEDNTIIDCASYGLEMPAANGRNTVANNTFKLYKANSSLAEAIIISSFVANPIDGAKDNMYNKVVNNRFENWNNDLATKRTIKVLYGDTTNTTLNSSYLIIKDNSFVNSGSIIFENIASLGHEIDNNFFIQDAGSKSTSPFIISTCRRVKIRNNTIRYVLRKGINAVQQSSILVSNAHESFITGNIIELDSCFNYGIKDSDATASTSKNVTLKDNSVSGFRIDRLYFRTVGSVVFQAANNGTLVDYRNINNYYGGKSTEVLSMPNATIYAGYDSPEGVLTAKVGSMYFQAGSINGVSGHRGHIWIKNYQSVTRPNATGWSMLDGGGAIRDTLITAVASNFSTLNTKYPNLQYGVGSIVSTPYTDNGAGNWWVRLTATNWLKIGSSYSKTESDAIYQPVRAKLTVSYSAGSVTDTLSKLQTVSVSGIEVGKEVSATFVSDTTDVTVRAKVTATGVVTLYYRKETHGVITPSGNVLIQY